MGNGRLCGKQVGSQASRRVTCLHKYKSVYRTDVSFKQAHLYCRLTGQIVDNHYIYNALRIEQKANNILFVCARV